MSSAFKISSLIHLFLVAVFTIIVLNQTRVAETTITQFKVIEKTAEVPLEKLKIIDNPTVKMEKPKLNLNNQDVPKPSKPVNEVFGLNRKALTGNAEGAIEVKAGNTILKENDNKKLNKEDPDSVPADIPVPAEEYLVSEMPKVLSEFRAPYPKEAKEKNIEGAVILDLIIDQNGKVRWAKLVSGPGFGLNESALESIYKFQFKPARIDAQSVAVKIRYAIRFVLEK
ncbi:MAG: energy transducer TonB [Bacteriovoracaceae bacterium]